MKDYFVYMVRCTDGTYYVGMTNDGDRRIAEHNLGLDRGCYTFSRRPVVLVYSEHFNDVWDAISSEKKLKGWSHAKKSALVRGDWKLIGALANPRRKARLSDRSPFGDDAA
ncbi:MAG: GIY-YIG nuclease family protein [Candidatus Eremiobacteraeota bacterium]|nr:GIY-YIG nuclease family protein [Candidatus Eremiobacteraeota bacterium]MBV8721563.1 GIY-YIG nuclease family protein [Candidatus Eremiobacteraeota bacterium]